MFGSGKIRRSRGQKPAAGNESPAPSGRLWSVAAGWPGGVLPGPTTDVVIPADDAVIQDISATVKSLVVMGDLYGQDTGPLSLTAEYVLGDMGGRIEYGTRAAPRINPLTVTATGLVQNKGPNIRVDITARTGAASTKLLKLAASTGAITETITVSYGNPSTTFVVSGSISGGLGSGTDGTPFNNRVRFVSSGTRAVGDSITIRMQAQGFTANSLPRSIQRMAGADMSFVGVTVANPTVSSVTHIAANATTVTTDLSVGDWQAGDEVVVCPTDYSGTLSGTAQKVIVQSVTANSVTFTAPITAFRWGLLQYVTDAGLSLTAGTLTNSENAPAQFWDMTPKIIDERCRLVNISRRIKFNCPDDAAWQNDGYGIHTMVMGNTGLADFEGVEIQRGGQAGINGRYPWHWHMTSYNMPDGMNLPSDGTFTADVGPGHRVHKCSVNGSKQRAYTMHGVCGLTISESAAYDVLGHAFFMEDGSERRNTLLRNVVAKVATPSAANKLLQHDFDGPNFSGSSGYWLTNPDNVIDGNQAFNVPGAGFHNSFGNECFGLSRDVPHRPGGRAPLLYERNRAIANGRPMFTDGLTLDELGNTFLQNYIPTSDGGPFVGQRDSGRLDGNKGNEIDFFIRQQENWKNRDGYSNRIGKGNYEGWATGGNIGTQFKGATEDYSFGRGCLVLGYTLNNATTPEMIDANEVQCGWATYHETLRIQHNILVNFPAAAPKVPIPSRMEIGQGAIAFTDLYTEGWYGLRSVVGNKLINARMGYMSRPPHIDAATSNDASKFTFAGGVAGDIVGRVGGSWVFDHPFMTHGLTDLQSVDVANPNGQTTMTQAYGISGFASDITFADHPNQFAQITAHLFDRLDPANHATVVAQWRIEQGVFGRFLEPLKVATFMNGGVYRLSYGKTVHPTQYVNFSTSNIARPTDSCLVAFPWNGATPVRGEVRAYQGDSTPSAVLSEVASKALVESGNGTGIWRDAANNLVWAKLVAHGTFDGSAYRTDSDYFTQAKRNYKFMPL